MDVARQTGEKPAKKSMKAQKWEVNSSKNWKHYLKSPAGKRCFPLLPFFENKFYQHTLYTMMHRFYDIEWGMIVWINGNAKSVVTYTTLKKETQKATYQQEPPSNSCLKAGLAPFVEHQKASSQKNSNHSKRKQKHSLILIFSYKFWKLYIFSNETLLSDTHVFRQNQKKRRQNHRF